MKRDRKMSFAPRLIVNDQIAIAFIGGVVILVIRIDEWTVEFAEQLYAESTVLTGANPHTLTRVEGTAPGPAVRKRLAELQGELDGQIQMDEARRVAILTDSALVRGAMTAMRWITGDELRGFAADELEAAAAWAAGTDAATDVADAYRQCLALTSSA